MTKRTIRTALGGLGCGAALGGAAALAAIGAAGPAAADAARAPEGCEAFLTAQLRGCLVQRHRRCAGDPAGHRWMTEEGPDGATRHQLFDADGAFVEMWFPDREDTWALVRPADPRSIRRLLETGRDEDDHLVAWSADPSVTRRTRGRLELTGRTVVIDGERLHEARSEMEARDAAGGLVENQTGRFLVSERRSLAFPAEFEDRVTGRAFDYTPVEFIEPGEPGFAAERPIYDCGVPMSAASGAGASAPT